MNAMDKDTEQLLHGWLDQIIEAITALAKQVVADPISLSKVQELLELLVKCCVGYRQVYNSRLNANGDFPLRDYTISMQEDATVILLRTRNFSQDSVNIVNDHKNYLRQAIDKLGIKLQSDCDRSLIPSGV